MPNRPYPPEIEAGLDKALAAGPLRPLERRSIGYFRGIPQLDRVIDALCDGLKPHGLRIVVEPSEQYDGGVGLAVTRTF